MDLQKFTNPSGTLHEGTDPILGDYTYFIPNPPPEDLQYSRETITLLSEAERHLGMLSGAGELLPNPELLIYPYLTKEALLSSKIEGTMASLSDVFRYTADQSFARQTRSDAKEVVNYIKAMRLGLNKIENEEINLDLVKALHKKLLHNVRGHDKDPGEFRKVQNWIGKEGTGIGDSIYNPPAPYALIKTLHDFENYLKKEDIPLLIQVALLHYHFEAMHPFRDGNGRIGRLLITLFLCKRRGLSKPLLYLSVYFEKRRSEYYERLLDVSQKGEYEKWIVFVLEGIKEQSTDALEHTRKLLKLRSEYHEKVRSTRANGTHTIVDKLFENPFISIPTAQKILDVTYPTAKRVITSLEKIGILKQTEHKKKRYKQYCAEEILRCLDV